MRWSLDDASDYLMPSPAEVRRASAPMQFEWGGWAPLIDILGAALRLDRGVASRGRKEELLRMMPGCAPEGVP